MRVVRLGPRFARSLAAHAPPDTPERRAVARVIRELGAGELPGPGDVPAIVPPTLRCTGRPIASAGLVVCYAVAADGAVVLVAVMRTPPIA